MCSSIVVLVNVAYPLDCNGVLLFVCFCCFFLSEIHITINLDVPVNKSLK